MRGPAFKQVNIPADRDGDVYAAYNINADIIEYGSCGSGLPYALYHEIGHRFKNKIGHPIPDIKYFAMQLNAQVFGIFDPEYQNEEKTAWKIAAILCPRKFLPNLYHFYRIGISTYKIKAVSYRTFCKWSKQTIKKVLA